jgi:hypothetical protein
MSTKGGPNRETDGIIFSIDAGSRGFTAHGTGGTNNSHRKIRDLKNRNREINLSTTSPFTGKTYYTLYGLTYPESSQTPASRDGITPGFNNTTGTKTYDCSRDLNYFVFDEDSNTWISDSYFNGERISGHCYDTYDGQPSQHARFQKDFDVICSTFPNATHIVIGSHAAENNVSDLNTRARLETIGLPSDHTSGTRFEYILVGKRFKPWTWSYVRENVNSNVAHMNLALPLEGGYEAMVFDGTDDRLDTGYDLSWNNTNSVSIEFVIKPGSTSQSSKPFLGKQNPNWEWFMGLNGSAIQLVYWNSGGGHSNGMDHNTTSAFTSTSSYYHVVYTWNGSTSRWYINGSLDTTHNSGNPSINQNRSNSVMIGGNIYAWGDAYANCSLGYVNFYDKQLSASQVSKNYRAAKKRFNL